MSDEPHKMQPLAEFMAAGDALTPAGMARRYADAKAAGVEIGTPDNPYPGISPEELADMQEFKAGLLNQRLMVIPEGPATFSLWPEVAFTYYEDPGAREQTQWFTMPAVPRVGETVRLPLVGGDPDDSKHFTVKHVAWTNDHPDHPGWHAEISVG